MIEVEKKLLQKEAGRNYGRGHAKKVEDNGPQAKKKENKKNERAPESSDEAANMMNVTGRTLRRLMNARKTAPEVIPLVEQGKLKVSQAEKVAKHLVQLSEKERRALIKAIKRDGAKAVPQDRKKAQGANASADVDPDVRNLVKESLGNAELLEPRLRHLAMNPKEEIWASLKDSENGWTKLQELLAQIVEHATALLQYGSPVGSNCRDRVTIWAVARTRSGSRWRGLTMVPPNAL